MICKMLSVNSAHVSEETANWLNVQGVKNAASFETSELADIHVGSHGYGWFIYCHDEYGDEYPADLIRVLEFARKEFGCDYVNIDNAGEEHSGLEKYEW